MIDSKTLYSTFFELARCYSWFWVSKEVLSWFFRILGLFFPARLKTSSCMTYIPKNLKCDRLVISKRQSTELFKVKENHLACLTASHGYTNVFDWLLNSLSQESCGYYWGSNGVSEGSLCRKDVIQSAISNLLVIQFQICS